MTFTVVAITVLVILKSWIDEWFFKRSLTRWGAGIVGSFESRGQSWFVISDVKFQEYLDYKSEALRRRREDGDVLQPCSFSNWD